MALGLRHGNPAGVSPTIKQLNNAAMQQCNHLTIQLQNSLAPF
jgi:hypothetical protein